MKTLQTMKSPLNEMIIEQLEDAILQLETQKNEGWEAFHKLRHAVAEIKYPGLTDFVKTLWGDAERAE